MKLMRDIRAKEVFVGLALAAVLPTRYRFLGGVGVGEIALLVFSFGMVSLALLRRRFVISGALGRVAVMFLVYVLLILLPLTGVGLYFDVPGVSFRDWLAYALAAFFLLACAVARIDLLVTAKYLIGFSVCLIGVQYFVGGESAWYFTRFTAGAVNPNQLALYVVCGSLLALVCFKNFFSRVVVVGFFSVIGVLSGSDALIASSAVTLITYFACKMLPRKFFVLLFPLLITGLAVLWVGVGDEMAEWMLTGWANADQGETRSTLYINGLRAWLDGPLTAFMGNGAGSFSGLDAPYGWSEAHNTPIDMLTVGGVPGLLVCYGGFFYLIVRAYRRGENVHAAVIAGLIVFSLFHFVARHPIWWFSFAVLAYLADTNFCKRDLS